MENIFKHNYVGVGFHPIEDCLIMLGEISDDLIKDVGDRFYKEQSHRSEHDLVKYRVNGDIRK